MPELSELSDPAFSAAKQMLDAIGANASSFEANTVDSLLDYMEGFVVDFGWEKISTMRLCITLPDYSLVRTVMAHRFYHEETGGAIIVLTHELDNATPLMVAANSVEQGAMIDICRQYSQWIFPEVSSPPVSIH